jgi:hypothetical protein
MKRAVSFVLFCYIMIQSNCQNLATNPGFESWQKVSKPYDWTTASGCTKDSTVVLSGSYSCKQATAGESKDLGQIITVTPGKQYSLSYWYKNDLSVTGNGCRIWSNWRDADMNSITDETSLPILHSGYMKSEIWKNYTAEITAPANAAFFNLLLRTLPNSVTYWDDIVFEESVPTGKSEQKKDNIRVFPNPIRNYLTISNIQNIQHIDIQTITGLRIWTVKLSGEERIIIPVSDFKDGMYLISFYSSNKSYSRKIIKISE